MTDTSPEPVEQAPLSRVTAQALTQRIRRAGEQLWELLLQAYEGQAHIALGYTRWEDYVATEFHRSRGASYRLLDQARVTRALEEATKAIPDVSRARDTIHVSAREAVVLKDDLPVAAQEVAEAIADGATPTEAVRAAVEVRRSLPPQAEPVPAPTTQPEVLDARPVSETEPYVVTRADVEALVSHFDDISPADAARLLNRREYAAVVRWYTEMVSARGSTLRPESSAKTASTEVEPRFKKGEEAMSEVPSDITRWQPTYKVPGWDEEQRQETMSRAQGVGPDGAAGEPRTGGCSPHETRSDSLPAAHDKPEHLRHKVSSRGFAQLPSITSLYGGEAQVYESSLATEPAVWLRAWAPANLNEPSGPKVEVPIHLSAEDAWKLSDQLRWLVENHYQGDARPEWAKA